MFSLSNKEEFGALVSALIFLSICGAINVSCNRDTAQEKFNIPVEKVVQLDGDTELGITSVATNLNVPWEIAWGPDGQIWFTQQSGTVSKVDPHSGKITHLLAVADVYRKRTLGMLGMAVSLDKKNPYVFIDYTVEKDSAKQGTPEWGSSRLVRYRYNEKMDTLTDPFIMLEVPSAGSKNGHNGSRVDISPDGRVFWTTGEIFFHELAQDTSSPNGKILRLNMDGTIPADNPFPENPVWSLGHRNSQGLVFTPDGVLISVEHGEASDDELNIIRKGKNYGWPGVEGMCNLPGEIVFCDSMHVVEPIMDWTPTIAPSGIDYYNSKRIPAWTHSVLMATLKDMSLRVLKLNPGEDSVVSEKIYFKGYFGRLRDICISPDGDVYVSTSNRDWNPMGKPEANDDRIIRIAKISNRDNLSKVGTRKPVPVDSLVAPQKELSASAGLYKSFCSSCHKMDGNGVPHSFPNLNDNPIVNGEKDYLIDIVLQGDIAVPEAEKAKWGGEGGMPAFNFLKDEEITDIVNYIRTSWQNNSSTISAEDVKKVREKLKSY